MEAPQKTQMLLASVVGMSVLYVFMRARLRRVGGQGKHEVQAMKSKLGLVIVAMLAVAVVLVAVWQSTRTLQRAQGLGEPEAVDTNRTFATPLFGDVSEVGDELVLAGTAEPTAVLSILDGARRILQVPVDDEGEWTARIAAAPDRALELSLESFVDETPVRGDEQLLRVPAPGAEDGVAPVALILVTAPGGPSRVIQTPFGGPLRDGPLALDALDYDRRGSLIVAGSSERAGRVRLSSGERVLGEAEVGAGGRWFFLARDVLDEALELDVSLVDATSELARVSADTRRLPDGRGRLQDAGQWQVRRRLPGGGEQISVVFATPPETAVTTPPE